MRKTLQSRLAELLRFGIVGAVNTVLAYLVFLLLLLLGAPYYVALVFDYLFAIVFSLFANRYFTFRTGAPVTLNTFLRMSLLYGLLFVLNEGMLVAFVNLLKQSAVVGQAVASVAIAGISYVLQRTLVFRVYQDGARPKGAVKREEF